MVIKASKTRRMDALRLGINRPMLPAFCLAQTAGKSTIAIQEGEVHSSVIRVRLYFAGGLLCMECMERFEEDREPRLESSKDYSMLTRD